MKVKQHNLTLALCKLTLVLMLKYLGKIIPSEPICGRYNAKMNNLQVLSTLPSVKSGPVALVEY